MFTHSKSKVRVLRILMHLSAGHVTLLPVKFHPPPYIFSQPDLKRRVDSRWALPQIFSLFFQREISETRRPIGAKLCKVVSIWPDFNRL